MLSQVTNIGFLGSLASLEPATRRLFTAVKQTERVHDATSRRPLTVCQVASAKSRKAPRVENVPGEFYVDHTCIDCDTCRWMAPEVFSRKGSMSAVHQQPTNEVERMKSLQALLACPTASIHTQSPPRDIGAAHESFPLPVDANTLPGIYHCGYHSKLSYGATSYFIQRAEGNILVDSPRFTESLANKFEEMGSIKYMFLSHKDDVADHAKWAQRFSCQRILHKEDVNRSTADVEWQLTGDGPWSLGPDIDLIFVPGHTEGCVALHLKTQKVLFTGDHLAWSERGEDVTLFRHYNWFSVSKQVKSVAKLIPLDFTWILPGHGRRCRFENLEEKNAKLEALVHRESST